MVLAAGLRVTGTDQSAGMLAQARSKHPEVPARVLALQDLAAAADLRGRFDGLLCVDALEYIAPEDLARRGRRPGRNLKAGGARLRHRRSTLTARCLRPSTRARCPASTSREAATITIPPGTRHETGSRPPGSASRTNRRPTTTGTSSWNASEPPDALCARHLNGSKTRYGVPDIVIAPTLHDWLTGIDPVLDRTISSD